MAALRSGKISPKPLEELIQNPTTSAARQESSPIRVRVSIQLHPGPATSRSIPGPSCYEPDSKLDNFERETVSLVVQAAVDGGNVEKRIQLQTNIEQILSQKRRDLTEEQDELRQRLEIPLRNIIKLCKQRDSATDQAKSLRDLEIRKIVWEISEKIRATEETQTGFDPLDDALFSDEEGFASISFSDKDNEHDYEPFRVPRDLSDPVDFSEDFEVLEPEPYVTYVPRTPSMEIIREKALQMCREKPKQPAIRKVDKSPPKQEKSVEISSKALEEWERSDLVWVPRKKDKKPEICEPLEEEEEFENAAETQPISTSESLGEKIVKIGKNALKNLLREKATEQRKASSALSKQSQNGARKDEEQAEKALEKVIEKEEEVADQWLNEKSTQTEKGIAQSSEESGFRLDRRTLSEVGKRPFRSEVETQDGTLWYAEVHDKVTKAVQITSKDTFIKPAASADSPTADSLRPTKHSASFKKESKSQQNLTRTTPAKKSSSLDRLTKGSHWTDFKQNRLLVAESLSASLYNVTLPPSKEIQLLQAFPLNQFQSETIHPKFTVQKVRLTHDPEECLQTTEETPDVLSLCEDEVCVRVRVPTKRNSPLPVILIDLRVQVPRSIRERKTTTTESFQRPFNGEKSDF